MPGMSEPVALAFGLVRAEYHVFHLADPGQHDQPPFHPTNGLIFSRPGLAVVVAGVNSGVVNVTAQVHEHPVARPDTDGWDEVVDHSVESLSGQMRVASLMTDPPCLPMLTPFGPGPYRVRVHARGRDRAYDAHVSEPLEDYLLQIWPQPREPDLVHKQSDQCGRGFRQAALEQSEQTPPPPPEDGWKRTFSARLRRHSN